MTDTAKAIPIVERLGDMTITLEIGLLVQKDRLDPKCTKDAANLIRQQHAALVRANQFIENGIEAGRIQMPDEDCPDPAHETPSLIKAAIQAAEGKSAYGETGE